MGNEQRSYEQWHMSHGREPYADESLDGFIAVRAAQEGLPTTLTVTSLAKVKYGRVMELTLGADGLDRVAECIGVPTSDLQYRVYAPIGDTYRRFFGAKVAKSLLEVKTRYFSPAAIKAAPYHRAIWAVRSLPFCDETWEILINTCPHCGAIQKWHHAVGLANCDICIMSLTKLKVDIVPEDIRSNLLMAAGLIHPSPARRASSMLMVPPTLKGLDNGQVFELLGAIGGVIDPGLRRRNDRRHFLGTADPLRICKAMASAWDVIAGWPLSAERLFAERLAPRDGRFGDGNQGATIDFLDLADGAHLDPVLRTVIGNLRGKLQSNGDAGFTCKEAAKVCGATATRVVAWRKSGALRTVFHLTDTRIYPLIEKASLAQFNARNPRALKIRNVATTLGLSHFEVEQLIVAGELTAITAVQRHPRTERADTVRITAPSLECLLSKFEVREAPQQINDLSPISTLHNRIAGLRVRGAAMATLCRESLPFYVTAGNEPLCNRILVTDQTLGRLAAIQFDPEAHPDHSFLEYMTKKDAMEALCISMSNAKQAFDAWRTDQGGGRTVPISEVERLAREYIPVAEIAVTLEMNSIAAFHAVETAGLMPHRPYGYVRSEFYAKFCKE